MPKLLIRAEGEAPRIYHLGSGNTLVGRGEKCQLRIPGSDVAREQMILRIQNGKATRCSPFEGREQPVRLLDEIQVGRYILTYLEDDQRIYKGVRLFELPQWVGPAPEPTIKPQRRTWTTEQILNQAKIILVEQPQRQWPVGHGLTFGSGGQVAINDLLAWGIVARLKWDGTQHVLHREVWWMGISVDGQEGPALALKDGSRFTIGNAQLQYMI